MAEGGARSGSRFGYQRTSDLINRTINAVLATFLLVISFPILLILYLIILFSDGPPVFYVGERLGKHKEPFQMFKFRTLQVDAERIIGAELLSAKHQLTTKVGQVLRDTRLDELPQLVNILKGEMDFVGPRPVRREVYEKVCRFIPNYDRRFRVRPGLIGLAQLMTPHSTPKKMRALIDNLLIRKKQKIAWDLWYIVFTAAVVLWTTLRASGRVIYHKVILEILLSRYQEKRRLPRVSPEGAWVHFARSIGDRLEKLSTQLVNINDEAFLMASPERIPGSLPTHFELEIRPRSRIRGKGVRRAGCLGKLYRELRLEDGRWGYVMLYEPLSPLNFYLFHQYFLEKSVA